MELINRYVYAVIKRLPQGQRDDIEEELLGLIEDMLAERCAGAQPKSSDIEAVLKELGEPSKLADKYRDSKRYLIGPEFFEIYMLVLKIAISATVFGVALATTIELLVNPPQYVAQGLGNLLSSIITAGFSAFAWVTVVFAVTERARTNRDERIKTKEWDPSRLPEIPDKKSIIKRSEPIVGIVFAVLFIILFNFASQLVGIYQFEDGKFVSVIPLFAVEGLNRFLPLITMFFSISILKECIKLISGKWTLPLAVTNVILSLASMIFCIVIFTNPVVWNADFVNEIYSRGIIHSDTTLNLDTMWNNITKGFVYVLAAIFIIDSAASIYKGIKYKINL